MENKCYTKDDPVEFYSKPGRDCFYGTWYVWGYRRKHSRSLYNGYYVTYCKWPRPERIGRYRPLM